MSILCRNRASLPICELGRRLLFVCDVILGEQVNFHGVTYCVPKAGLIEMEDCVTNCIISSGFNHYSTCHVFEKVNHVEGDRLRC